MAVQHLTNVTPIFCILLTLLLQPEFVHGFCWRFWAECCDDYWIPGNTTALAQSLNKQVYGQHLVFNTVVAAVQGHFEDPEPSHPLVISFHGPTGTGKNYVSKIIAESVYRKGMESQFVHLRISTRHYKHKRDIEKYKDEIQQLISSNVYKCSRQLFIFDESENMPPGLLDSFRPFFDYHAKVDGIDYRKSIFIFLSNMAAHAISNYTMNHYMDKKKRESIKLLDMESVIKTQAYDEEGKSRQHSALLDSRLVSHFIPFLPLEIRHVRQCIDAELQSRSFKSICKRHYNDCKNYDFESIKNDVLNELPFYGPKGTIEIFATKGCKNVKEKLNLVFYHKYGYPHSKKKEL